MHNSAYINAEKFYNKYCESGISDKKILDVGSYNVNGTMKPIFDKGQYIGLDMENGDNVDIVGSSHDIPFKDEYFDIVISSSCFEHDDMFWVSFIEMCRVLKKGGYMYIQAPQNGPYHGWPGDNWRFYIDSWKALEKWGIKMGWDIELVESYIDTTTPPSESEGNRIWNDSIGIYRKKTSSHKKFDIKDIEKGHHNLKYNNVSMLKCPFDYPLYQMIINEVNPDLIIEIGTHHGGNSLYMADLLRMKGNGMVHTIDIKEYVDMTILDNHPNIVRFLGGFDNYDLANTNGFNNILVVDDGSHQYHDVKRALEKFSDIVSVNSYFIVEDGVINELGYSEGYDGGPLRAITEFVNETQNFVIEHKWSNFFGENYTFNPMGYLKKIKK
jgi:cephalosporin hydroxylase